ncbi:hypothetical protein WJX84_005853 [Apatococcus fuscideae]|uniref:Iron-containing redox enzyme family protein n=1 Tax=Apatococcus fuscideae TaxID=2026836 RepID=A0AAW1SWF2_9CHLO
MSVLHSSSFLGKQGYTTQLPAKAGGLPTARTFNKSVRPAQVVRAAAKVDERPEQIVQPVARPRPLTNGLSSSSRVAEALPSFNFDYDLLPAEKLFTDLLHVDGLDKQLRSDTGLQQSAEEVKRALQAALQRAFGDQGSEEDTAAHLFVQRILYKINRSAFFWYDDLKNYRNERSLLLAQIREDIEEAWYQWELQQNDLDVPALQQMSAEQVKDALRQGYEDDVDPPLSALAQYIKDELSNEGYKHMMAVGSVDGLVEASKMSRVTGGVGNETMCAIYRIGMEEYGTGRFSRKHSSFYGKNMRQLGLSVEPEHYFDICPWQTLAVINLEFIFSERRRNYLKFAGGLCYFEIAGPSIYRAYVDGAKRLGHDDSAAGYWDLHIGEDLRHGKQMITDVVVPLVDKYPDDGWELLLGYIMEKRISARAGGNLLKDLKAVDEATS